MKTFIASIITFFVILSSIIIFTVFLNSSVKQFNSSLDKIIKNSEVENWSNVKNEFKELEENWNKKVKLYEAFKNHDDTNSVNNMILNLKLNVEFKKKDEVILNSNKLKIIFNEILDDELPTFENVIWRIMIIVYMHGFYFFIIK